MPLQSLDDVEADFIRKILRETRGNRALAAEILGQQTCRQPVHDATQTAAVRPESRQFGGSAVARHGVSSPIHRVAPACSL